MSYSLYKLLHLVGILTLFAVCGVVALHAANGGDKAGNRARKLVAALHGLALVVILVSGFGLLARLGVSHGAVFPGWIWVKLALWLVLGGIAYLPYRKPELSKAFLLLLPAVAVLAAWLALYKPF